MNEIKRNLFMDNLKGFLIFCVVLGHIIESYGIIHSNLNYLIFFIYLFHMPCFIYVSGYFSKKYNFQKNASLIYDFIIFGLIYIFIVNCFPGYNLEFKFAYAPWALWYLIALFAWRTSTVFLRKINPYILIGISLICAIFIGCFKDAGTYFSIGRIIGFFPFFLLGYYSNNKVIDKIRNINKGIIILLFVIIIICTYIIVINNLFPFELQWASKSFSEIGVTNSEGILFRILLLVLEIIASVVIINLIPKNKTMLSKIGENSITIYGFHLDLVFPLIYFIKDVPQYKGLIYLFTFGTSLLIVVLLSSKPIRKFYEALKIPYKKISENGEK